MRGLSGQTRVFNDEGRGICMEILIISGLSGGGKSKAASFLEDSGFYIV